MTDVPATKLAILAISKPIANVIKERATKSHFFRQYVAMPPAQCNLVSMLFWRNI